MERKPVPGVHGYELVGRLAGTEHESNTPRNIISFSRQHPWMLVVLAIGVAGSFACFAFTYWLATTHFDCPTWALYCTIQPSARFFAVRLGLVQGFVSSLYGLFVTMIAHTAYKYAETTLWPTLVEHSLTLKEVDDFLSNTRGSLAALPRVLWNSGNSRKGRYFSVMLTVALLGLLLQANATVAGWAYTVLPITTNFYSNHTYGGGMGFGIGQANPQGLMPEEPTSAYALYVSWASGASTEPLPQLRNYWIDRTNVSQIGDFTVNAVKAQPSINCSAMPITFPHDTFDWDNELYTINTTQMGTVLLRYASGLTSWVDSTRSLSSTRAVTRLYFAQFNGTIEGGFRNALTTEMADFCERYWSPCAALGISSLACDIDIDLTDSVACTSPPCSAKPNVTLTSLEGVNIPDSTGEAWPLAVSLSMMPTIMGPYVFGAQPMMMAGTSLLPNSSLSLPVAFADVQAALYGVTMEWSQDTLTNYIEYAMGALSTFIAQAWPKGSSVLQSSLEMSRMDVNRSFVMLAPPLFALICVGALALLSSYMYRKTSVLETRLGTTGELLISANTPDLRAMIVNVRSGAQAKAEFEQTKLNYGRLVGYAAGLGKPDSVKPFVRQPSWPGSSLT